MTGTRPLGARNRAQVGRSRLRHRLVAVLASLGLALGLGGVTAVPASARAACVDLQVASLSASPSNPVAGTDVLVRFTVKNSGTCSTPPQVPVRLQTDTGEEGCCVSTLYDLGPGQTSDPYSMNIRFGTPGAHVGTLVADPANTIAETDETNNAQGFDVSVQPATVDLTITDVSFDPVRPVRGRPMKAIFTVRNLGSTAAKPFTVIWSPAYNQSYRAQPGRAVAGGASTTVTFTYTYATYWNIDSAAEIPADPNVNPETSYTNNWTYFQVPVDPALPDLVVQGVHVTPSNPQPGQTVTAAFVVKNIGNTNATPFQLRWQPSAQAPVQTVPAGGLAAGARRTLTFTTSFATADVVQGTATVDPLRAVAEIEEGNNVIVTSLPVAPNRTNLKMVAQVVPGTTVTLGQPFPVEVVVWNTGNTASGPFAVDWIPDPTGVLGPGNRTVTQDVANLDRGERRVLTFMHTYWTAGTFQAAAAVDALDRVVETSDRDNRFAVPVSVGSPDVDLEVTRFALAPAEPLTTSMTTAAVTVKNTGEVAAGPFVVQWKLPAGSRTNPRTTVRGLAAGESRTITFGGTFADAGSVKTSAVVDVFHQVKEPGKEGNNTATRTVTVVKPPS